MVCRIIWHSTWLQILSRVSNFLQPFFFLLDAPPDQQFSINSQVIDLPEGCGFSNSVSTWPINTHSRQQEPDQDNNHQVLWTSYKLYLAYRLQHQSITIAIFQSYLSNSVFCPLLPQLKARKSSPPTVSLILCASSSELTKHTLQNVVIKSTKRTIAPNVRPLCIISSCNALSFSINPLSDSVAALHQSKWHSITLPLQFICPSANYYIQSIFIINPNHDLYQHPLN